MQQFTEQELYTALVVASSLNSPDFKVRGVEFTRVAKGVYRSGLLTISSARAN